MMKKLIWLAVSILLFVLIFFVFTSRPSKACFKDNCFILTIADSEEERSKGLMNMQYLPPNKGMLFIFENSSIHKFWMKDTLIPLDIIWINETNSVVHIENALPCSLESCKVYYSNKSSKYVLEINFGLAKKLNLSEGSQILLK